MKTLLVRSFLLTLIAAGLVLGGCSDDDGPATPEGHDFADILTGYAGSVVVPTYATLRDRAASLQVLVEELEAAPSQTAMNAAAAGWVAAREPWEASEAFLFGPANFLSLDPAIDSWPVDHQQLDEVLASGFELTPEFVAEGLGPALRGFHTVEYLLFREGQPRDLGEVTAREREYLVAAATVLAEECHTLWAVWAEGLDGGAAFAVEFAQAGGQGSRYVNQRAALQEMVEGMILICDEVANGKIADPYDEQDTSLVESQFSFNSLADFQDNLRSVRNAYRSRVDFAGTSGTGLESFIAGQDGQLDVRLRAEIDAAILAIGRIPGPFRDNLDAATEIEAAQSAIATVLATLAQDVLPLVVE